MRRVASGPEQLPGPQIWMKIALPTKAPPALAPRPSLPRRCCDGVFTGCSGGDTHASRPRGTLSTVPHTLAAAPRARPSPTPTTCGFQPHHPPWETRPLCPQALACFLHRPSQHLQSGPGGLQWPCLTHLPHAANSRMTGLCVAPPLGAWHAVGTCKSLTE